MKFDFDQVIDRRHTNAMAIEGFRGYLFGHEAPLNLPKDADDLISMWVADMAFGSAPAAAEAIRQRLDHPVLGYTMNFGNEYHAAFASWTERHYGWSCQPSELFLAHGVVPALYDLVEQLCAPDERVLTFTPAYGYFKHATDHYDRELVTLPLGVQDGRYTIDFDGFAKAAAEIRSKVLVLCHPHNPTGRLWTDEELLRVGQICVDNNLIIISDEIHCDLLRLGQRHTPLSKLLPDNDQIVTLMSPSKTFNLAGLLFGNVIIRRESLRQVWRRRVNPITNPLSLAAAQGVFTHGDAWLLALRTYLDRNFAELESLLRTGLPKAVFRIPDATYMAWIDLSGYFSAGTNLTRFFVEEAGVILEGGEMFVADGGVSVRVNVACPRQTMVTAVERMIAAVERRT